MPATFQDSTPRAGASLATLLDAGHIPGSASVLLELKERGVSRQILFSGDIGPQSRPLLRTPCKPPHADFVVMEATYGDRLHKPLQKSVNELYDSINAILDRGGNVLIPSFALERAQELLYLLSEGIARSVLPAPPPSNEKKPPPHATVGYVRFPFCTLTHHAHSAPLSAPLSTAPDTTAPSIPQCPPALPRLCY